MKNYIKILSVTSLALLAAASCSKQLVSEGEDSGKKTPEGLVKVEFSAVAELVEGATKTSIDESTGAVSWTEGDKVLFAWDVNSDSNSAESDAISSISSETGAAKIIANLPAAFSIDSFSGSRTLYGVYPSSLTAAVESSKFTLTVPSVQDGSFEKANISVAEWSEGSSSLSFKNVGGLLQFKVEDASVRKAVFDAEEAVVAGSAEVTFAEGAPSATASEGSSTITLNISGAGTYYLSLLPVTLNGFSVELQDEDGNAIARQTIENSLTVSRGHIIPLGTIELGFDDKFFVTPEGRGSKNGRSWDNAADIAALREFVSTDTEAEIYLSEGTYSLTSPFESDAASSAKFTVRGGYPSNSVGCSTEGRDASANATVFDGGSASRIWVMGKGTFSFDGITVQNANSSSAGVNGGAFGIASTDDETVFVSFTSCKFLKNSTTAYGTGTSCSGGVMELGAKSKVDISDCRFEGNYARNGGSINSADATSVLNVKNTTFSGDFTYNTSGSVQCANGTQVFENCTFEKCYTREGTGGALHMGNTAKVTVKGCTFKECEAGREKYSYLTTDNKALGGAISTETSACLTVENCTFDGNMASAAGAILVKSGNEVVKVNNSVFKNNKCASRGIIQMNGNAVLFLNNCRFFDNTMRTNAWGVILHGGSPAAVCMNNCTFYNNTAQTAGGNSVCLNHDGWFIGTNCSVIGNNALATYRINSSKATQGYWYNSVLANAHNTALALNSATMTSVINTTNCILGPKVTSKDDLWVNTSSLVDENILTGYGASFDSSKQVWLWNGPADSFTKTTESAVKAALEKMTDNNGNTTLGAAFGPAFAAWVDSLDGFTKDCLGNTRTASGTWPGAVEIK